jgi:Kdo2-lipid IVA lauroyltransferase/acyltransferase
VAKPRRPAVDFAVYLVVRAAVCVAQAMPMKWAFAFADLVGWAAYRIDKRHRAVAAENIRAAFPTLGPRAVDRMVRGCYKHYATVAVEMLLAPRKIRIDNWRRYSDSVRGHDLLGPMLVNRPAMMVTGHFGNWEVAGYIIGVFGLRSYAIARVLDNPHLERFLKKFRQATGQTLIAKKDDFERLTSVMRTNGKVATLADQDAGPRGVFVDFFGRPASAHKAVALMAMEYDSVMIVFGVPRIGPGMKFRIECEDLIDPREYAGRPDAVKAITQRYHAALERLIRRHPEQYFWLHRRWKTQPAAKKAKQASAA